MVCKNNIIWLHTYGADIHDVRTLNNHALCAGIVRIDGVYMSARARAESICIGERCRFLPADVGETEYG